MSKRYRLKVNLPDLLAGAIFYEHPMGNYYITERNYRYLQSHPDYHESHFVDDPVYHMSRVENNSTFFELVDPTLKEDFIWTDELVAEYCDIFKYSTASNMQDYKRTKVATAPTPIPSGSSKIKNPTKEEIINAIENLY